MTTPQPPTPHPSPAELRRRRALERREQVRADITDAAVALAAERGLGAVTVTEIAARAGVSRRTFFNYFPSKTAAVIPTRFALDPAAAEEFVRAGQGPTLLVVGRYLATQLRDGTQIADVLRVSHDVLRSDEPGMVAEISALLQRTEGTVARLVGVREGLPADDPRCRILAASALAAVRVAVQQWGADDHPGSLAELVLAAFGTIAQACTPED